MTPGMTRPRPDRRAGQAWAAALVIAMCACRGGGAREERPPLEPASPSTLAPADATAPVAAPNPFEQGMPRIALVLEDPRLAAVRQAEQAHDWSGAARMLDGVRAMVMLDCV